MSLIEEAAKRLEQLRNAGIELPDGTVPGPGAGRNGHRSADRGPMLREIEALAEGIGNLEVQTEPEAEVPAEPPPPARTSKPVTIDVARLAAAGMVTPETARTKIADEFRVIKRPLLNNALRKSATPVARANMIMVTSALPGEGKTFTSVNLAMSMAMELDSTVLLVDADVAKPTLPSVLRIHESKGLMDALTDPALDLADVLLRTNVNKLTILPAGTPHERATELLASDAMERLIAEIAERYADRIVVFDAPPLLPTTESRVLASHMGQIVLVVEAEQTPEAALKQAMTALESCPVVMTVLNKSADSELGSYYGYGYAGSGESRA